MRNYKNMFCSSKAREHKSCSDINARTAVLPDYVEVAPFSNYVFPVTFMSYRTTFCPGSIRTQRLEHGVQSFCSSAVTAICLS